MGPEEIPAYQVYLTNERKLAPGSVLIAVAALRFLYKVSLKKEWPFDEVIPAPKAPQKLPVILSPEEVLQCLDCVGSRKYRAILTTCYAAGLRISEAVCLKPSDIDSKRMVIRVDQGKGQKDLERIEKAFNSSWDSPITDDISLYAGAIVIQSDHPVNDMEKLAQRTLSGINPNLTIVKFQMFDQQIADRFTDDRMIASLTSLFGALALMLATIELYGVTAYSVVRRTPEIGRNAASSAGLAAGIWLLPAEW